MKSTCLRVTEIFTSLQGEGPSLGACATFLRLAGCNLSCAYCDTPYTWDTSRYDVAKESRSMTVQATLDALLESELTRLVVTGGEPLLQQSALTLLINELPKSIFVEIETNATIVPSTTLLGRVNQWNLSPKLRNAGLLPHQGEHLEILSTFLPTARAYLKLVITEPQDLVEADELVESLKWPKTHVVLMPEGRTAQALAERSPWVAEAALRRGQRFSTRLHVLLWGDERGR
jgi:organic radical activating enzyme